MLQEHFPSTAGSILVTTRYSDVALRTMGNRKEIELLPFDATESAILFRDLRQDYHQHGANNMADSAEETFATTELLDSLGGLAVGIEHMAAYIECDKLTVWEFNQMYKRMASQIHERTDTGSNAPHTLHTLWAMSFEKAQSDNPDSFHFLHILSFLAPDEIPLAFFDQEDRDADDDDILSDYSMFCDEYSRYVLLGNTALHS